MKIITLLFLTLLSCTVNASFNTYSRTIIDAAWEVDIDPVLLVAIAHKETRFRNIASNAGGSAEGLFQFNDVTWRHMLNKYANDFDIPLDADKYDVRYNSIMAAVYVRDNTKRLTRLLRRQPTSGEIYLSHLLGPTGVRTLLTANPNDKASDVVAYAYPRNKPLFLTKEGKHRTVRQFRDYMNWRFQSIVTKYEEPVMDMIVLIEQERETMLQQAQHEWYRHSFQTVISTAVKLLIGDSSWVTDVCSLYMNNSCVNQETNDARFDIAGI